MTKYERDGESRLDKWGALSLIPWDGFNETEVVRSRG